MLALLAALALQGGDPHVDAARGFSIPVPQGWSIDSAGDDIAALRMSKGDARFALRLGTPMRAVNGASPILDDLAEQLRVRNGRKFKEYEHTRVEATARTLLLEASYLVDEQPVRCFQYIVSDPSRLCVLTWTAPAESYEALRATFESASRAFALRRP